MTDLEVRAAALSLRDLTEATGALEATLTLPGEAMLTWSVEDGFQLVPTQGDPLDITDWVEWTGLLPAEGVESVRDQFVTLAAKRGADV